MRIGEFLEKITNFLHLVNRPTCVISVHVNRDTILPVPKDSDIPPISVSPRRIQPSKSSIQQSKPKNAQPIGPNPSAPTPPAENPPSPSSPRQEAKEQKQPQVSPQMQIPNPSSPTPATNDDAAPPPPASRAPAGGGGGGRSRWSKRQALYPKSGWKRWFCDLRDGFCYGLLRGALLSWVSASSGLLLRGSGEVWFL
jgi:hypothetical protein